MPAIRTLLRNLTVLALTLPVAAYAADPITGIVTNKTTNKPAGGDDVVLIRLQQGMQESTRTKTDARGHFKLEVPDDGIHLVRVTHDKANYFRPAPPGTQSVQVDVFDSAVKLDEVVTSVQELHVEATGSELHVVEVLQVLNHSVPQRTQFGPAGFDFFLPPDARIERTGAVTDGGMPVQTAAVPVGDPGHYTFLFPVRPGETQFGIFYSLPYNGKLTFKPRLTGPVNTLAIVLPKSMTLEPGRGTPYASSPGTGTTQTYIAQNAVPSQPLDFTISGTGQLPHDDPNAGQQGQGQGPQQASPNATPDSGQPLPETQNTMPGRGLQNPLDPEGTRDPWAKYKWWILGGLTVLLAAAAGVLLRKPSGSSNTPVAQGPESITRVLSEDQLQTALSPDPRENVLTWEKTVMNVLKEELFTLETEHLQNRISESEYREYKAAIELILRRALNRTQAASAGTSTSL